ncbi:DUF302 domain-containing protein [Granulicella mallensis]|uniref:Uncharacterized protein (DUF302 family) n=1 Tax=Granulicella mallensis TaxID=940614 RepID=A0A7W7ZQP7_9BACT|nr:DUF302 domain-containing protein [Granulicella mallensis]MBB5064380.1 uncharacterized protein (DUF302 family) [Granulicella mallensis]
MSDATRTTHDFAGKRIEVKSSLAFDEIMKRLREQTGKSAVPLINEIASQSHSPQEFDAEVTRRFVGPSGFMLFAEIDHSGWITIYGIHRRVLRIILGNPLLAITMMREDLSAGLFAPVEVLLVEDGEGSTLYYVQPSSLMVIAENEPLLKAAVALDHKLEELIGTITGLI